MRVHVRITENRRLATAAAAIKQRIVILNKPLVFLPVLPFKKGSAVVAIVVGVSVDGREGWSLSCISVCSLRPRQGSGVTLIRDVKLCLRQEYMILKVDDIC